MNKQQFTQVVKQPVSLQDEVRELQELQVSYPYAQSVHVLLAMSLKGESSDTAKKALNVAAMYVNDRQNLKDLLNEDLQQAEIRSEKQHPYQIPKAEPEHTEQQLAKAVSEVINASDIEKHQTHTDSKAKDQKNSKVKISAQPVLDNVDEVRDQLLKDLRNLQASKQQWADFFSSEHDAEPAEGEKPSKDFQLKKGSTGVKKISEKSTKAKNTKTEELENKSSATPKTSKKPATDKSSSTGKKAKAAEKEGSGTKKIKQQQELISKFIENSSSIKTKASNPPIITATQQDLSVSSTSFKDNLISENLADIMVSQGKIDKAVDIYKKLIWKFPQKKAYFAARIEELTKKKG